MEVYLYSLFTQTLGFFGFNEEYPLVWSVVWVLLRIIAIIAPLMFCVAYLTLIERRVIGWMQVRKGPNRVGPLGLFQPVADGLKLFLKEILIPQKADKALFLMAPMFAIAPALAAWAVIPFFEDGALANIDGGLLYLLAISSIGIYGVIIAGWASNSKYPFLGAIRAAAQMVSYELAMGMALITVLMISGSLNLGQIINSQATGYFYDKGLGFLSWNFLPLFPMFIVYLISGIAETNRAPFDVVESESEMVAGHMVEYSGITFALFFLAEYANMILISAMTAIFFFGGWLSPVSFLPDGVHWLLIKVAFFLFIFLWVRATFPRFRYDQIMRLGWKVFIPICLLWIFVLAIWMLSPLSIWD